MGQGKASLPPGGWNAPPGRGLSVDLEQMPEPLKIVKAANFQKRPLQAVARSPRAACCGVHLAPSCGRTARVGALAVGPKFVKPESRPKVGAQESDSDHAPFFRLRLRPRHRLSRSGRDPADSVGTSALTSTLRAETEEYRANPSLERPFSCEFTADQSAAMSPRCFGVARVCDRYP